MNLVIKHFSELSLEELYKILRARVEIFVVEQNCPYQDVDNLDQASLHLFYEENGEIQAYLRLIPPRDDTNRVTVGRVITVARGTGLGRKLLESAIPVAVETYHPQELYLHAQCYAIPFYEKVGFVAFGDEFLEDGIPHREMLLKF